MIEVLIKKHFILSIAYRRIRTVWFAPRKCLFDFILNEIAQLKIIVRIHDQSNELKNHRLIFHDYFPHDHFIYRIKFKNFLYVLNRCVRH